VGRIGRAVAKLADAFGMKVLAHDVHPPEMLPAKNCYITPHIGWAARARLMHIAVENLRAFLDGWPVNVVNI
jgi:glycerate dehydrogenase